MTSCSAALHAPAREPVAQSRQALRAELSAKLFDRLDEETWERLEEALILADVGARRPRRRSSAGSRPRSRRRVERRRGAPRRGWSSCSPRSPRGEPPRSTCRAKPAVDHGRRRQRHRQDDDDRQARVGPARRLGLDVIVAAADTYRAAAVEQLDDLGGARRRRDRPRQQGGDPGAVVFDAIAAAEARGADVVIADTAGRLHTARQPDGGAGQGPPRGRQAARRGAARDADGDRRDHRAERPAPGAGVRRRGRA